MLWSWILRRTAGYGLWISECPKFCSYAIVLVPLNDNAVLLSQAKVFLALMPVHEPETAPHRNARLAGLKDIVTILHRCANLQSQHPALLMLACQCAVVCAA